MTERLLLPETIALPKPKTKSEVKYPGGITDLEIDSLAAGVPPDKAAKTEPAVIEFLADLESETSSRFVGS